MTSKTKPSRPGSKSTHLARFNASLVLAVATIALTSCNDKSCPPPPPAGVAGGGPSPQWVHKGAAIIRDLVPELPSTGATVTATLLTCPLSSTYATIAKAASVTLALQTLTNDSIDPTSCSATPTSPQSYWQLNDAGNGPAFLFVSKNGLDVFSDASGSTIIYWKRSP